MMPLSIHPLGRTSLWARRSGWFILVAWAVFWSWFSIAAGASEIAAHGVGALASHLAFVAVIGVAVFLASRAETAGGIALLLLAAFGQWFFGPSLAKALLLTVPPLVAGTLLVACGLARHRTGGDGSSAVGIR
jgi:hypothetical protein